MIPNKKELGGYIRECVGYESDYTEIDYTNTYVGSVSGENTSASGYLHINFEYQNSGTITASISGYANSSTEASMVFATMKAEVGVEAAASRSWTVGTSAGASYDIPPGEFAVINAYIPVIKTSGRLKYKVYMDTYPDDVFYEYKTLNESYAPQKYSVHFKLVTSGLISG